MNHRFVQLVFIPASLLLSGPGHADLATRNDVQGFISQMVSEYGFEDTQLKTLFGKVELQEDIISAISRPAESKPWHEYRPIFITESRIEQGAEFWREHAEVLAEAERRYGVPPSILVAILGVETRYGRHRGDYRVMDSLSTLAFDYPPRAKFFRGELKEFLVMAREEAIDPLELTGSYAGAMGQPQFIPSSFRAYAVDFDDDGRRDLWENIGDVIGSVANYFAEHRWQPGQPIATRAKVNGTQHQSLLDKGYRPSTTAGELGKLGVEPQTPINPGLEAALIALEAEEGMEHWVALHNFYVITRYNHSPLYAMAVHQLAEGIRAAYAAAE
ncbi:lytic murein transglycosylase B [Thiohalomonas denitrificans]|uniref:lytic murein transglycosylase B n=1 Tax=Thiohalomonas denitrificans TaxID=415747 RepID=UPI0026EF02A1|nr:lytic murein transglycosylase B [Thiohalomonas denitrificans]